MDTGQRLARGVELLRSGRVGEAEDYLAALKKEDSLASALIEVYLSIRRHASGDAVKKGTRLLTRASDKPDLARFLFMWLGTAYRLIGEIETAHNYFLRALEMGEHLGDRELCSNATMEIFFLRFCKCEYATLYPDVTGFIQGARAPDTTLARYLLVAMEINRGESGRGMRMLDSLLAAGGSESLHLSILEMRGSVARMAGRLDEAMANYLESARGYAEIGGAYSAFPCAKALELSRFAGLEPPEQKLISSCLGLSRKGSWGEMAAASEVEALLASDDAVAARGLYSAGLDYHRAYQPVEAFMASLCAAYLAWQADSPVFQEAVKFLAPLAPLHPGFARDPLLGDFLQSLLPLIQQGHGTIRRGMRARLLGGLSVSVDGEDLSLHGWRNAKAVAMLVYLLLSPKHRMAWDHLLYLLWPGERHIHSARNRLHVATSTLRKHLGRASILVRKKDFYQLEETLTDLDEIEDLVIRAEATQDPARREELFARAAELAREELLPEIIDDPYVDEYRLYYERLRKRISGSWN